MLLTKDQIIGKRASLIVIDHIIMFGVVNFSGGQMVRSILGTWQVLVLLSRSPTSWDCWNGPAETIQSCSRKTVSRSPRDFLTRQVSCESTCLHADMGMEQPENFLALAIPTGVFAKGSEVHAVDVKGVSGKRFTGERYRAANVSLSFEGLKRSELRVSTEHKPCPKWIVVTSVFQPSQAVRKLGEMTKKGWCFVVVGDVNGPPDFDDVDGVTYLTPNMQKRLHYHIVDHIPWRHFGRKNIGYLYAIEHGAEIIYDTDDDNRLKDLDIPMILNDTVKSANIDSEVRGIFAESNREVQIMTYRTQVTRDGWQDPTALGRGSNRKCLGVTHSQTVGARRHAIRWVRVCLLCAVLELPMVAGWFCMAENFDCR